MAGRGEVEPSGFGEKLREVREAKGLTQKQLADASDIHSNTIAKLERGEQEPNWPLGLKLVKAGTYTHLRAYETRGNPVSRFLLEKKN